MTQIDSHTKKQNWPDPVEWIEKNFWIPELKGPIQLGDYQKRCIREALSREPDGNFKYSTILWSDIKKSAKSSIAAAVNLYVSEHADWGENYVIANDLKQADSRVAHYLRRAVELNPDMRGQYKSRGYRYTAAHGSFIEAIPIDPSGEAGSNADMITFSELHGAHEDAKQRMWAEMTLSPTKHGKSFRWIETYAGYLEESLLLWSLYERGVMQGELIWPDEPFPTNFDGPQPIQAYREGRMFCLWNQFPRLPWQTKEYYDEEEKTLGSEAQFDRMHRNKWATSEEMFVPIESWDSCRRDNLPVLDRRDPVVVSMDAGTTSDNFAMVMTSRHPDDPETVVERMTAIFEPPKGRPLDFVGTTESPGPELVLREWLKEYNVIQVAYDPYQLHDMATRLYREGLAWFKPFSQGSRRLEADSDLRHKILGQRILHSGNPLLRQHVMNANAKTDEKEDRKIRIVKRSQKLKVDAVVALSMAAYETMRLNL